MHINYNQFGSQLLRTEKNIFKNHSNNGMSRQPLKRSLLTFWESAQFENGNKHDRRCCHSPKNKMENKLQKYKV